jgi:hypothetical protein
MLKTVDVQELVFAKRREHGAGRKAGIARILSKAGAIRFPPRSRNASHADRTALLEATDRRDRVRASHGRIDAGLTALVLANAGLWGAVIWRIGTGSWGF